MSATERSARAVAHPLEPLNAEEIAASAEILRRDRNLGDGHRFVSLVLHEPPKEQVLGFRDGNPVERKSFAIILDKADGATYEAVVSLSEGAVESWEHVPGVQPQVMLEEFFECEEIVKADPEFREALGKRGITDFDSIMVDPWSAGHYGDEEEGRLLRALAWIKLGGPDDNGYAHPIENVFVYVDLNKKEVARVEDHGVVPVPKMPGNYVARRGRRVAHGPEARSRSRSPRARASR